MQIEIPFDVVMAGLLVFDLEIERVSIFLSIFFCARRLHEWKQRNSCLEHETNVSRMRQIGLKLDFNQPW
jgi:hypothetical protein